MNYCVSKTMVSEALKEIVFWSNIQQQHMTVLSGILPEEASTLKAFQEKFIEQYELAKQYQEELSNSCMGYEKVLMDVTELVNQAQNLNGRFAGYLMGLEQKYPEQKLLLTHIGNETKYYMKILSKIGCVLMA